jgi:hypothetical protein
VDNEFIEIGDIDMPGHTDTYTFPAQTPNLISTLDARGKTYGEFADNALIAQSLKDIMRVARCSNWNSLSRAHQQALDVIMDKVSRILTGDPNYVDNWHDIQGYAKLVENIILTGGSHPPTTPQEVAPAVVFNPEYNKGYWNEATQSFKPKEDTERKLHNVAQYKVIAYTKGEGKDWLHITGIWLNSAFFEPGYNRDPYISELCSYIHALKLEDGRVWDRINGFRGSKNTPTNSNPEEDDHK